MRAMLFCITFGISTLFPIVASVTNISAYRLVGYLDVSIACILFIQAIFVYISRSKSHIKGSRKLTINIFKTLFSIPLLLLVLFFLAAPIKWDVLTIGLAWRFWLLSFVLEDLVHEFQKAHPKDIRGGYS